MAAHLWAGHYILQLWFLSFFLLSFFFPRLFSAAGDWMSTILPHVIWHYSEFKMHVWNVVHVARWKYKTQKLRKNGHLCTIAHLHRVISPQLRHISTIGKMLNSDIYSTYRRNMVNFGLLKAEIGWRVWASQQISTGFTSWLRYCSDVYSTEVNHTLHDVWPFPWLVHCMYTFRAVVP